MTYNKPQLLRYSAIAVVQSGSNLKNGVLMELPPNQFLVSPPAYEADE